MAQAFEIKVKATLSEEKGYDREARVLNRVIRLTEHGISYEADPRHVELVVKALDLQRQPKTVTPGVKDDDVDIDALLDVDATEDALDHDILDSHVAAVPFVTVNKIKGGRTLTLGANVHVRCGETTFEEVQPYSEMYGCHPRTLFATKHGTWKRASSDAHPFS